MDCTYDTPKSYDGTAPSNSLEAFQFSHASCIIPTATPSATLVSSTSGYIDVASTSALAHGIHDITDTFYIALILIGFACFFTLGRKFFE